MSNRVSTTAAGRREKASGPVSVPRRPVVRKATGGDVEGTKQEEDLRRWEIAQERMRRQLERIRQAQNVRDYVEIMFHAEVEEGAGEDDMPMSPSAIDKRKQRIKDWLGHLVRLQLAHDNADLARAKFDLTKKKVEGDGVRVGEDIVLDHEALVNWLEKRPDLYAEFKEERDALERS